LWTTAASFERLSFKDGHVFNVQEVDPATQIFDGRHCGVLPYFRASPSDILRQDNIELIMISSMDNRLGSTTYFNDGSYVKAFDESYIRLKIERWHVINVMLIQWKAGALEAERLADGQIHEYAWVQADLEWKHIRLA
jgi:hypothetical protein